MAEDFRFNPTTGKLDLVEMIPQLDADPASPVAEEAWVLATASGGAGVTGGGMVIAPLGLGFIALTPGSGGAPTYSYEFKYRTKEGTTVKTALS